MFLASFLVSKEVFILKPAEKWLFKFYSDLCATPRTQIINLCLSVFEPLLVKTSGELESSNCISSGAHVAYIREPLDLC